MLPGPYLFKGSPRAEVRQQLPWAFDEKVFGISALSERHSPFWNARGRLSPTFFQEKTLSRKNNETHALRTCLLNVISAWVDLYLSGLFPEPAWQVCGCVLLSDCGHSSFGVTQARYCSVHSPLRERSGDAQSRLQKRTINNWRN